MTAIDKVVVRNVSRLFGATAALRSVSCEFEAGTMTFVQGANGAGKSTLLSIIGTALAPTSGLVRYSPLPKGRALARAHIGWVGHSGHCYGELTGRENIELAAKLYSVESAEAVAKACERVSARRFVDSPVATMSRGQKQRIALARALVHSPALLLLDEPLSGLDIATAGQLDKILLEEVERGAIVVVVSHREGWAKRLGARELFLERGRLKAAVTVAAPVSGS